MDTFENNEFIPEESPVSPESPVPEQVDQVPVQEQPAEIPQQPYVPQAEPAAYRGAGSGRKESPYANSPYVMNHASSQEQPQQQTYQYQPQYAPPQKPKKEKKVRNGFWKRVVSAVAVVALVAASSGFTAAIINKQNDARMKQLNAQMNLLQSQIDSMSKSSGNSVSGSIATVDGMTPGQVYAQNVDCVVAISTTVQTSSIYGSSSGSASGSGFILTEDGYVITNYHVVEGAKAVSVITHSKTEYTAEIVGTDKNNDVAVLKVDATGLPAATIGSSDDLVIGDMVVAIGNPLGTLTATQTVGYVSGKDRDVSTDNSIINMIQTDAAINSGNSGGPLFNMKGEVVGITTAKYSGTSGSGASIEGIGFAIPINDVTGIISDLMDYGYVTGAYLGVTVRNMDSAAASMYGLPLGAYVETVEAGGAASRAGIQPKDIIINLGGHEVETITDLSRAMRKFKAGDTTTITVNRSGAEVVMEITMDEKPQTTTVPNNGQAEMPSGSYEEWYNWFFGNQG